LDIPSSSYINVTPRDSCIPVSASHCLRRTGEEEEEEDEQEVEEKNVSSFSLITDLSTDPTEGQ
jgi:hypothetical protein